MLKTKDAEFREVRLKAVTERDQSFELLDEDGWSFAVQKPTPAEPRAGSVARFYGRGLGYPVRGLDIDGVEFFYQSAAEHRAKQEAEVVDRRVAARKAYESKREQNERDVAALPGPLRNRIAGFYARNPEFWEHFPYELFVCQQAAAIAAVVPASELAEFRTLKFEAQRARVPAISEDHSGNTFGMSLRLAHWLLTNPENVEREHGALCPLLGCKAYGCHAAKG